MVVASLILFSQTVALKGGLFGQPITITNVTFKKANFTASARQGKDVDRADVYDISFTQGKEFIPAREIKFQLLVNPGQKFDHYSINQPCAKFGTPEYSKTVHGHTKGTSVGRGALSAFADINEPKNLRKSGSATDQIAFSLSTKRQGDGYLATIRARVPEHKTWVQGTFTFQISKG